MYYFAIISRTYMYLGGSFCYWLAIHVPGINTWGAILFLAANILTGTEEPWNWRDGPIHQDVAQ
jgi:hypothetical protein